MTVWEQIFDKQTELTCKFSEIERNNGFLVPSMIMRGNRVVITDHLEDPHFQDWLKSRIYCTMEELLFETVQARTHEETVAEVIDALHFLTELTILLNKGAVFVEKASQQVRAGAIKAYLPVDCCAVSICMELTALGHCLRNKPWKVQRKPVDKAEVYNHLFEAWRQMLNLLLKLLVTEESILEAYMAKHKINETRIQDGV